MKCTTVCIMAGLACILLLAAGCTTTPGPAPATTAHTTPASPVTTATRVIPAVSWAGTWNDSWSDNSTTVSGILSLNQSGSLVTGMYSGTGTLAGISTGNRLVGAWGNSTDMTAGPFEFVMSTDNRSFTGRWANSGQDLANSTEFWNGVRA